VGVGEARDPEAPRFNERLDHLQARHPLRYNLVTGAVIGAVLWAVGLHWAIAVAYAASWAIVRALLWREGRVLRRQYEVRVVRVAEAKAAKRRAR
jgi:hypothetical protein